MKDVKRKDIAAELHQFTQILAVQIRVSSNVDSHPEIQRCYDELRLR